MLQESITKDGAEFADKVGVLFEEGWIAQIRDYVHVWPWKQVDSSEPCWIVVKKYLPRSRNHVRGNVWLVYERSDVAERTAHLMSSQDCSGRTIDPSDAPRQTNFVTGFIDHSALPYGSGSVS